MSMLYIKKFISTIIVIQLMTLNLEAAEAGAASGSPEFNLQEVALPSEVKDMGKSTGSIFYNVSVKNKVLVPVHMWGELKQTGLHFIPSDTPLIKGLSLAGGPTASAKLEKVILTRPNANGTFKEIEFDLSNGGDDQAHRFKLESGDTIFIKKETFYENRNYYTSLISIFITVLSTFVIFKKIE